MNSILKSAFAILSAVLLSVTLGCASTGQKTGLAVDDAVITTKVKSKIAADEGLKVFDIHVDTHDGVVQLSGFVDRPTTAERAVDAARTVNGVKLVRNDMRVK
jgi:hyperosmotically inducible protein